jgi:hypothetical protein
MGEMMDLEEVIAEKVMMGDKLGDGNKARMTVTISLSERIYIGRCRPTRKLIGGGAHYEHSGAQVRHNQR